MSADPTDTVIREVPIVNQRGLHARASAKFVQVASEFDATVQVERDGVRVGGTTIMGLMMLAASPGWSIRIMASRPQAEQAVTALEEHVAARFGEDICSLPSGAGKDGGRRRRMTPRLGPALTIADINE